jgi:hypothetical protein
VGSSGRLITSSMIADGAVATADLAPNAVSQVVTGVATAASTYAGTGSANIPGSAVVLTTTGGPVLMVATGFVYSNTAGSYTVVAPTVDGVAVPSVQHNLTHAVATAFMPISVVCVVQPAAGGHTFGYQWSTSNASHTSTLGALVVAVLELKR